MERDYQPIPELDTYEEDIIDREDYESMSPSTRYMIGEHGVTNYKFQNL